MHHQIIKTLKFFQLSILERRTFHQGLLERTGQRQMLLEIMTHFHELNPKKLDNY